MKKAVIYARYSSSKQREESIEGQIRVCTDYALKQDLVIAKHYIDREISGKTDARPQFQQMIADAKARLFDVLVVYKTDRFARNKYDSAIYKTQLKKAGVQIMYAAETIPEGPEGILIESIMEGYAEFYSAELAQKVQRGMHENALKCRATGATPFGYYIKDDHTYGLHKKMVPTIKEMFQMYADGAPVKEIINMLNSKGYKTSTGAEFTVSAIQSILRNEKYTGVYKFGDVRIEGGVPKVISKELFDKVQKVRESRQHTYKLDKSDYYLTGKLFCGSCNCPMVGISGTSKSGSKYSYYRDKTKKHTVRKDLIEEQVVKLTLDFILQPKIMDQICKTLAEYQKRKHDTSDLKAKLNELIQSENRIMEAIKKGGYVLKMSDELRDIEKKKSALEEQINQESSLSYSKAQIKRMFQRFSACEKLSSENQKRVLAGFVSKVYYYPSDNGNDPEIKIEYHLFGEGVRATQNMVHQTLGQTNTLIEIYTDFITIEAKIMR